MKEYTGLTAKEILDIAEEECDQVEYYNELKDTQPRQALAFKLGMVSMNLAMQIEKLERRLFNLKNN